MTAGAFITVEGAEGVGKSTCLGAIEAHLKRSGFDVVVTREPGGTSLGEAVRSWVLEGDHGPLGADVEALLMFAARAHHLTQVIRPALANGSWVVCDRFTDATFAYQGGGRGADPDFLRAMAAAVHAGLEPDLTLLLDAPVSVGLARIAGREHDHFEREDDVFFERVRKAYLDLAAAEPGRIEIIDATAPPERVHASIAEALDAFCARFTREAALSSR